MLNSKKILAIITARGGSKGLPGKNIKELHGKPLIVWTIEKALKSKYIDKLIVSTDSKNIAEISEKAGALVPFIRPSQLADDKTPTIDVIQHAVNHFIVSANEYYDYVAVLEPTSPLREDEDIDNMIFKLCDLSDSFDSIISVGEIAEHPSLMMKAADDKIDPFCSNLQIKTRRQDNETVYFPYGVAYIAKVKTLLLERTFFANRCTYYVIKRYQNYEIDGIYDFLALENIMRYEWGLK